MGCALPVFSDSPKRRPKVGVIVNQYERKLLDRSFKVRERSDKSGHQLFRGNIMPALRNTHRYPLLGNGGIGNPDVTEHDSISGISRLFQKRQFVSDRIGEDCFKDETFTLSEQFKAESIRDDRCLVRADVRLRGDIVSVNESQAAGSEMRMVKRRLTGTIRPRERDDDRPRIQDWVHLLPGPFAEGQEFPVHKPARGACAILVDANKVPVLLFVVRKGTRAEVLCHAPASGGGVDIFQAGGERLGSTGFSQRENFWRSQKRFDRAAEPSPKLDLPGDGSLRCFREETSIQDKIIGQLHRLTHRPTVAKRYRSVNRG